MMLSRFCFRALTPPLYRREFTSSIHERGLNALRGESDSVKDPSITINTTLLATSTASSSPATTATTAHTNGAIDSLQFKTIIPKTHSTFVTHSKQVSPPVTVHSTPKPSLSNTHLHEFAPKIVVVGVGGAGGNAINNMIAKELAGVDFLALNTDAQHLSTTLTDNRLQLGIELTRGLGCGANPDAGRLAAEECRADIEALLKDAHMVFVTAGMGGGTGTGAAPVIADICYQLGILTVGVVTLPFSFEGSHRKRLALEGLHRLEQVVDTLIVVPNQNLFQLATPDTSFVEAFAMADDVLLRGVQSITDLMTSPGMINLDFADVQSVMHGMGHALLGTGQASGDNRAIEAAQLALDNPLLSKDMDISTAKGMLVNITGGADMTLFEVDKAAQCVTDRVKDANANIIFGSAYDATLSGQLRVSVVATGIDAPERR
jgi:cell division protein FtsZ